MDNNQMNGMQNNMNPNGVQNQVPVDNGMNQTMAQPAAMPVNNGMPQAAPQQMPVDAGMTQAIPQQMPMDGAAQPAVMPVNNGMPQAAPQQMPMNGMPQQQMPGAPAPKKSNTGLIILIIVIGVVILGLAGFIVYDKFIDVNEVGKEQTNNEEIVDELEEVSITEYVDIYNKPENQTKNGAVMGIHDSSVF